MNRTALCIKMLQKLKASKVIVSKKELAEYLETNERNISEFKKELETAGYDIETINGRYGGYRLNENSIMPLINLNSSEKDALINCRNYINSVGDMPFSDAYDKAMDKILSTINCEGNNVYSYYVNKDNGISAKEAKLYNQIKTAIKNKHTISFEYRSLTSNEYKTRRVHPYDIVVSDNQNYLICYSLNEKDYRKYKISDIRMRNFKEEEKSFTRNLDYRLSDHVGKENIYHKDDIRVKLHIKNNAVVYLLERHIGIDAKYDYINEHEIYYETTFENEYTCDAFILSLGEDCEVIEPNVVRERITNKICSMSKLYKD